MIVFLGPQGILTPHARASRSTANISRFPRLPPLSTLRTRLVHFQAARSPLLTYKYRVTSSVCQKEKIVRKVLGRQSKGQKLPINQKSDQYRLLRSRKARSFPYTHNSEEPLAVIEAGIDVLAERIKNRRNKNSNHDGMDHLSDGPCAYDLRDRSAAHPPAVGGRRVVNKQHRRRHSISK